MERADPRRPVLAQNIHVDAVGLLEVGAGEEVEHELVGLHPVRSRDNDQTAGMLDVRLVMDVAHHRELLLLHELRNLPDDVRR